MPKITKPKRLPREIETFPTRLKALRVQSGMTQAALADRSGLDPGQVSRLESGKLKATNLEVVIALAKALGSPSAWLATGEGRPPEVPVFREGRDKRRKTDGGEPA